MVEIFCESKCILGEGPVWSNSHNALFWLDILGRKLCKKSRDGVYSEWFLPRLCSAISVVDDDRLLLVTEDGLYAFSLRLESLTLVVDVDSDCTHTRSNDGASDALGRLWFGTMDKNASANIGKIFSYHPEEGLRLIKGSVGIPNTFVWSPDSKKMYMGDSMLQTVYEYEYSLKDGSLRNEKVFFTVDDGAPDGSAMDEDGYIWNAQWDRSRVVRYDAQGKLDLTVELPVPRPTSCTFGGAEGKTLFITSARDGLTDKQLDMYPLSGAVFMIDTDVRGVVNNLSKI